MTYFIGIDIPDHIKDEIRSFTKKYMAHFDSILNWIHDHEYHITIAYLGLLTKEQRERLIGVSDGIITSPFTVHLQGMGFYPSNKKAKRIWLGIGTGREKIKAFGENIRREVTMKAGLIPKDSYFPHMTIAKIKTNLSEQNPIFNFIRQNWDYPFGAFKVNSFHLYRVTKNGYAYNHEVKLRGTCRIIS